MQTHNRLVALTYCTRLLVLIFFLTDALTHTASSSGTCARQSQQRGVEKGTALGEEELKGGDGIFYYYYYYYQSI